MSTAAQTQRIHIPEDNPCLSHEFRITALEKRMDKMETMPDTLNRIDKRVDQIDAKLGSVLWPARIIAGAALVGVVNALLKVIMP